MVSDEDMNAVILSVKEAVALSEGAIRRIGYSVNEAKVIAANLVSAELMGYPTMGITRILTIAEHPLTKQPRTPISVTHETMVSARVDCGNYVGLYAMQRVAEIAIKKAQLARFAVVGAHNSFLSGRNAYYLDMIARKGFVGVHLACSQPVVAPLGAAAAAFGTNPIAIAIPHHPHPIILDMGTAAVNSGDVILASRLGHELDEGTAIDGQGRPTLDPFAALAGAIMPFGGHRGSSLSFIIQALGLLGGAALTRGQVQDFGFLFILFDPELLMPGDQFQSQIDELIDRIKDTPRQPGAAEFRFPSQRSYAESNARTSIALPALIYENIRAL
jgi:LDH2 family malate/lactate/ureidoglycolate dehydrogenase